VDQYNQEYSRDCEPMRGGHSDNYYYQLAAHVRRFKGVRKPQKAAGPSQIVIDGSFSDWKDITPEFRDTIGDTAQRNHAGYGNLVYRNTTGRNDFVIAKAAHDRDSLFFFVQTLKEISPRSGRNWMLLLLDADRSTKTGWLGYDYVVNLKVLSDRETSVKVWRDGTWVSCAKAAYQVNGNGMELQIRRSAMGRMGATAQFDFHWADNIQSFDGVSELGVNGDSAPNRRWNYRYEIEK